MQKYFYRQLTPTDYDEYKRIWLDCLKLHPDNFGTTYEEGLHSKSLKLATAINASDEFNFAFGAFIAGQKLIGHCGLITDPRIKARHRSEIVQVFVDPAYQGQGIGKKLLQLSIDKAFSNEQTEQIVLSVTSANERAIGLYQRFGFAKYGRLENFFKSGAQYSSQSFFYLMKKVDTCRKYSLQNDFCNNIF